MESRKSKTRSGKHVSEFSRTSKRRLGSTASTFSDTVKDMKSQLPDYDEVSWFANRNVQETAKAMGSTPGAMPKPGRTIEKLNIEDLPTKYPSTQDVLLPKPSKSRPSKSRGKVTDEYNLISKFDTTVFNLDNKLAQAAASKLKTGFKTDKKKASIKTPETAKLDFLKSSANFVAGIEKDLGFGFRSNVTKTDHQKRSQRIEKGPNASQVAMRVSAKKTESSIQALKKKINAKREEWNSEQFGWDGYHYRGSSESGFDDKTSVRTATPNEKLSEMSRQFRDNLNVNTDMKKIIRTPKSSLRPSAKSRGLIKGPSQERVDGMTSPGKGGNPEQSALFTRNSALFIPIERKSATPEPQQGNKGRQHESSGFVKLKTLLDNNANLLDSINGNCDLNNNEEPDATQGNDTPYKKFNFGDLKQATSTLVKSFSKTRAAAAKPESGSGHSRAKSPSGGEVRTMSEYFYTDTPKPGKEKAQADDFIKQRLGESVKNVDDAATIASRLGSLMTKVAACKTGEDKSGMDTVSLARELRELATSMEKDYGKIGGKGGSSLNTRHISGTVETQTDREPMLRVEMPQPKFTKQMSYTDQLVLRKLREVRQSWSQGVQDFQGTTANDVTQ